MRMLGAPGQTSGIRSAAYSMRATILLPDMCVWSGAADPDDGEAPTADARRRNLLREFLKPRKFAQVDAAARTGMSANRLNEVIRGKRRVSADTALRLAKLLKTRPESRRWPARCRRQRSSGPRS